MYIKLTKMDGSPIWLNAAFVVTIEPHRKSGGSLVVPVGDGLDYEVKEPPESVLAMLDGAPVPAVLPIPTSDALTVTPEDLSPDDNTSDEDSSLDIFKTAGAGAKFPKPEKKPTAKRNRAKTAKTEDVLKDENTPDSDTLPAAKKKSPAKSRSKKKVALKLTDTELERLRKLAPKTLKKLTNTVSSQFKVEDVNQTVDALTSNGIIALDGERVIWTDHPDTDI